MDDLKESKDNGDFNLLRLPLFCSFKVSEKALRNSTSRIESEYCVVDVNGGEANVSHRSPKIDAYRLEIYPNGKHRPSLGEVWIDMHMTFNGENWNRKADFTLSIPSNGYSHIGHQQFSSEDKSLRWEHQLCTTEELFDPANGYFKDGWMELNLQGSYESEEDDGYWLMLYSASKYKEFWMDVDTDFTIFVEGKEIRVHKYVLAEQSPVFLGMFKPHTKEAQESKVEIIGFPYDVVETVVKLCYGISKKVKLEDAVAYYQFADKYIMSDILDRIEQRFIDNVSQSTVCDLANVAGILNAKRLENKCCRFLAKCMKKNVPVLNVDDFNPEFVMKIFKNAFCQHRRNPVEEDDDEDSMASDKESDDGNIAERIIAENITPIFGPPGVPPPDVPGCPQM